MRKRHGSLVLAVWLLSISAWADDHWGDVAFSKGSTAAVKSWLVDGNHLTVTIPLPFQPPSILNAVAEAVTGKKPKVWNFVLDVSTHKGDHDNATLTQVTYLAGPRFSVIKSKKNVIPYFQLLGGVADPNQTGVHKTGPAIAPGAGLERVWRTGLIGFGVRFFADLVIAFKGEWYPRGSIMAVVRIHEG